MLALKGKEVGWEKVRFGRTKTDRSCVQGFPDVNGVLAGFHDGTVVLSQINPSQIRSSCGTLRVEVIAIAVTETGSHILIGDAEGEILWFNMQQDTS